MTFEKNSEISFRKFIKLGIVLLILSSVGLSTGESLRLPPKIGVEKIEIDKPFNLDGKKYYFSFLDGMLIDDGVRRVTIDGKDYLVEVRTSPQKDTIEISTSPYAYMFNKEVKVFNPENRSLKPTLVGKDVKLADYPQIALFQDDFNNIVDATFIFPLLEKLDILDSQLPITNITGRKFLLSSRSPYRILSKVLITEKNGLILEEGVTLINTLNSELTIKGTFITTGPISIIGSGTLNISDKGILYLKGSAYNTDIGSDRGALVFLDGATTNNANLSMTNFVIIRKSQLKKVSINGAYALYIIDSNIQNLSIQNCGTVFIVRSNIQSSSIATLSRAIINDSYFGNLQISDFSETNVINTTLESASIFRGAVLKTKNCQINLLHLEDYSVVYTFKTKISQLKHHNAKYYLLESKVEKVFSQ
ncbi:MAG: hypothetical protein ABDH59_07380 [Fervidobacterium sp.]